MRNVLSFALALAGCTAGLGTAFAQTPVYLSNPGGSYSYSNSIVYVSGTLTADTDIEVTNGSIVVTGLTGTGAHAASPGQAGGNGFSLYLRTAVPFGGGVVYPRDVTITGSIDLTGGNGLYGAHGDTAYLFDGPPHWNCVSYVATSGQAGGKGGSGGYLVIEAADDVTIDYGVTITTSGGYGSTGGNGGSVWDAYSSLYPYYYPPTSASPGNAGTGGNGGPAGEIWILADQAASGSGQVNFLYGVNFAAIGGGGGYGGAGGGGGTSNKPGGRGGHGGSGGGLYVYGASIDGSANVYSYGGHPASGGPGGHGRVPSCTGGCGCLLSGSCPWDNAAAGGTTGFGGNGGNVTFWSSHGTLTLSGIYVDATAGSASYAGVGAPGYATSYLCPDEVTCAATLPAHATNGNRGGTGGYAQFYGHSGVFFNSAQFYLNGGSGSDGGHGFDFGYYQCTDMCSNGGNGGNGGNSGFLSVSVGAGHSFYAGSTYISSCGGNGGNGGNGSPAGGAAGTGAVKGSSSTSPSVPASTIGTITQATCTSANGSKGTPGASCF